VAFQLVSPAFSEGGLIPALHTCEGADLSPALEWSGEPQGTKSFALIVDDPDAPFRTWNHWLVHDISPTVHSLAQGQKPNQVGKSGINDFNKAGYGGPCPPRGHGLHRYFFRLQALDVESLGLPSGARRGDLDRGLKGHVLAEARLMGRYERK